MAVYVDNYQAKYRNMKMCHMLADTIEELHTMADKIGLKRKWFQISNGGTPHYDISLSKRLEAINNGAIEIDRYKVVELIRFWRTQCKCFGVSHLPDCPKHIVSI
jgi:hypothetical protein